MKISVSHLILVVVDGFWNTICNFCLVWKSWTKKKALMLVSLFHKDLMDLLMQMEEL